MIPRRQSDPCHSSYNATIHVLLCTLLLLVCQHLPSIGVQGDSSVEPEDVPLTSIRVFGGPSLYERTKCPLSDRIGDAHYVTLQYNATIDSSSPQGTKGLVVDSTHKANTDFPDPIMVKVSDSKEDPLLGWVKGLLGLCSGDFVTLVVPPELAYGDEGDGEDIPGGAVLRLDIQIVTAHTNPEMYHKAKYLLEAEDMFQTMDSDGDGKVTLEEMELFLNVPEDYPNREKYIRQHFELSDYNRDGTVSLEEFKTILENFQGIDEL